MKKTKISVISFFLALILILSSLILVSCKDTPNSDDDPEKKVDSDNTPDADDSEKVLDVTDEIPEMNFGGDLFTMLTFEETHADMHHVFDEISDDPVDLAKYQMILSLEERFGCDIKEYVQSETYVNSTYRGMIRSGADDYDIVFAYDRFAHYFAEENLIYNYDDLTYINLEKDYWDQSLLNYTNVGGNIYYAYGTYDFTYYDLTHCLVFNKTLLKNLGLENVYDLVYSGNWTMDKMYAMCKEATMEVNGDGEMTAQDSYGLISSGKQILPNFWISGGTTTITLDDELLPCDNINGNELLSNIIDKCFSMFWGDEVWYRSTGMGNQSDSHDVIFKDNRALFADYTFYYLNQLRDCETDFGIVPYPKYDSEQKEYYSRVEAGTTMATVPITNPEPEKAGAIIEGMASVGYQKLLPAYYESVLKRKTVRDEESQGMIDIIFKTRVYDLGDTWFCDQIRDGLFATMWNNNSNNMSSLYRAYAKKINKTLDDTREAYSK